jgi:hypothetical protein
LLRLPAVGDNAAMQAEPPKAEPPKRKRRWFQFSLRTLMIVVAIVAVQCAVCFPALKGWQYAHARARLSLKARLGLIGLKSYEPGKRRYPVGQEMRRRDPVSLATKP